MSKFDPTFIARICERTRHATVMAKGPISIGFICGFMGVGPIIFFSMMILNAYPSLVKLPFNTHETKFAVSDYNAILASRILSANRNGRAIVIGSSEFEATPDGPSLVEIMTEEVVHSGNDPPLIAEAQGSAVTRTLFLLDRLHLHGIHPEKVVIVINPFYATEANGPHPGDLRSLYPDEETMTLDYANPESFFMENPALREELFGHAVYPPGNRMQKHMISVQNMFRDGIGIPLRERMNVRSRVIDPTVKSYRTLKIDSEWGVERSIVNRMINIDDMRERRSISGDLTRTHFGVTVRMLGLIAERLRGKTAIRVLILPVNRIFYRKLNLDPILVEEAIRGTVHEITAGTGIKILTVKELIVPGLFYDSIHFTVEGRRILARAVSERTR